MDSRVGGGKAIRPVRTKKKNTLLDNEWRRSLEREKDARSSGGCMEGGGLPTSSGEKKEGIIIFRRKKKIIK